MKKIGGVKFQNQNMQIVEDSVKLDQSKHDIISNYYQTQNHEKIQNYLLRKQQRNRESSRKTKVSFINNLL